MNARNFRGCGKTSGHRTQGHAVAGTGRESDPRIQLERARRNSRLHHAITHGGAGEPRGSGALAFDLEQRDDKLRDQKRAL
jgi:hypothetical protein